jgi:hypothetical protein
VPRYVHAHGCSAEHPNVSRRSATPSTGVSEAKRQSPDAEMRARERDRLFDMVKNAAGDVRPHPEERACEKRRADANLRTRVSKDEDEQSGLPSCFETHRSALRRWQRLRSRRAAMLLSMREEGAAHFGHEATRRTPREGPTCTCGRRWSIACALLFTMKIPTETCGPFASAMHLARRTQAVSVVPARGTPRQQKRVYARL